MTKAAVVEVDVTSTVSVIVDVGTETVAEELAVTTAVLVIAVLETGTVVTAVPGTKGVPFTWVKSIQEVVAKKVDSSNWATLVSSS